MEYKGLIYDRITDTYCLETSGNEENYYHLKGRYVFEDIEILNTSSQMIGVDKSKWLAIKLKYWYNCKYIE